MMKKTCVWKFFVGAKEQLGAATGGKIISTNQVMKSQSKVNDLKLK